MKITGPRPNLGIEARNGLQIVVEDVWPGGDNRFDCSRLVQKIGGQDLDRRAGRGGADRADRTREMLGAAIIQIVPIDRSHNNVRQPERRNRLGDALRLVRVEKIGPAGRDIAEGAGPSAHAAENHDRCMLLLPTFADIRAARLFAHGIEGVLPHQPACRLVFGRARRLDAQPIGLARDRVIGTVDLFGMTRGRWCRDPDFGNKLIRVSA